MFQSSCISSSVSESFNQTPMFPIVPVQRSSCHSSPRPPKSKAKAGPESHAGSAPNRGVGDPKDQYIHQPETPLPSAWSDPAVRLRSRPKGAAARVPREAWFSSGRRRRPARALPGKGGQCGRTDPRSGRGPVGRGGARRPVAPAGEE
jgi:hypothetical protein